MVRLMRKLKQLNKAVLKPAGIKSPGLSIQTFIRDGTLPFWWSCMFSSS